MNELFTKIKTWFTSIKWYLIIFGFGLIIGALCLFGILSGYHSAEVDRLSATIRAGEESNRILRENNSQLEQSNRSLTESVDKLGKELSGSIEQYENRIGELSEAIERDNREHQDTIRGIKEAVNQFSEGIRETEGTIQDVINGLGEVILLIKNLPIN